MRSDWNKYFIDIALAVSKRSTCLRRNYGAVIVSNNTIISTGYNGSARGQDNCIDLGVCIREKLKIPKGERYELCVAIHAEANAIISGDPVKMKGAKIYIAGTEKEGGFASGVPCLMCDRMIKNAMIEEVIFLDSNGKIYSN
ncbi:MAG: cytidine deaminase [Candidatus Caldatribacteriota bacterium]